MIIVSACLLGLNYRYDGGNNLNKDLIYLLHRRIVRPVCPEVEGGLPVPRPPAEIKGGDGFAVLANRAEVIDCNGRIVTSFYQEGARKIFTKIGSEKGQIDFAVLKARSPACGVDRIYSGNFDGVLKRGSGVGAALLQRRGIDVYTDQDMEEIKRIM